MLRINYKEELFCEVQNGGTGVTTIIIIVCTLADVNLYFSIYFRKMM